MLPLSSGIGYLKKGVQAMLPGFTPSVVKAKSFSDLTPKAAAEAEAARAAEAKKRAFEGAKSSPLGRSLAGSNPVGSAKILTERAAVSSQAKTLNNPVARAQSAALEKASGVPQKEMPYFSATGLTPGEAMKDAAFGMAGMSAKSPVEAQEAETVKKAKTAMAMNRKNQPDKYGQGSAGAVLTRF